MRGGAPPAFPRGGAAANAPFVRSDEPEGTLVVHRDFEASARALGLPSRAALLRLFAGAPASAGRAGTAVAELPGRPERLHLRPVRHGGLLAELWGERILGLARPIDELRTTETLRQRGAPVPRALLVAGWRVGAFWRAVVGTLQIEDARDGVAWLETSPPPDARLAAAAAAGSAVRRFHDAGGRHADLHVKNLLLHADGRVFVIDLDRARAGAPPHPARRMRELMRLYRSLLKRGLLERVGDDATRAFFDAYTGGDDTLARALMARYPRERRRIARHALGYRRSG